MKLHPILQHKFIRYTLPVMLVMVCNTWLGSAPEPNPAKPQLVIDFCSALRGYLEPCG